MISTYLIDIIILLMAAVIAVPAFQAIKFGAVPGFLIAGVIVGPSGLRLISNVNEIGHLAEIGVVLLLFVIGMELRPSQLWLMRRLVFGLGSLQVLFTGVAIGSVCYFLFNVPMRTAILVGPALALSSTAFVLQLLTEQKSLLSKYGRASFSILLLQDIAVVPLLALLPLLSMPELSIGEDIGYALVESVLILGLVILVGRYFLHPILHRVALSKNSEIFTASAVLIVLGTALITEHIGLSMAMGAFLAGMLISDSYYKHQVKAEIQPFRGLLLGLFFMSMGMSLNLAYLIENPVESLGIVSLLIFFKVLILFPLVYLFGLNTKNSLAVALVLAQSGEFALVLFALANKSNLLSDNLFQQLLLAILLSMLATPFLAYLAKCLDRNRSHVAEKVRQPEKPTYAPIVLAGFGHVGSRIGEIFKKAKLSFVAIDLDASIVKRERRNGYPVFFGDVCKPELLESVGAGQAKIIIVTLNNEHSTEQLVVALRKSYPDVHIYVRGHSLKQCRELRKMGAEVAVSENVEMSLELARLVLKVVDIDEVIQGEIVTEFRKKYYFVG